MRNILLAGLALASLAACAKSPTPDAAVTVKAMEIGGKAYRCLKSNEMNVSLSNTVDLHGDMRARLLSLSAIQSGVRVYVSSTTVNEYGQVVLYYSDAQNTCLFWSESIPFQEYNQRLGLNPVGISPFFEVTPAPAKPTPAATPAAAPVTPPKPKLPYTKAQLDDQVGSFKVRDLLRSDIVAEIEKEGQ